jgi:DnaJ-class molecular chaperone
MARRTKAQLIEAGREARRKVELLGIDFDATVKAEVARLKARREKANTTHVSLWLEAAESAIYPCKCGGRGHFGKTKTQKTVCYACKGKGKMDPNDCERQAKYLASRKAS